METAAITADEMKILIRAQQGELNAVKMYLALAKTVKDPKDAEVFRQLAEEEGRHAAVFRALTGQSLRAGGVKAIAVPALYRLIGKRKLYPVIAKGEYDAEAKYRPLVPRFPEVESIRNDEKRHGDTVLSLI